VDPVGAAPAAPQVQPTGVNPEPSASGATCHDFFFPVTISPEDREYHNVYGRLCGDHPVAGGTLLVLLHGGSYNSTFWDWPVDPDHYSFVKAAAGAGLDTLNLDRLGYGHSDHPFSGRVDFSSNAWVAHQVAQYVRGGAIGTFGKLVLIGHSMGGFTAVMAAGTYPNDFDGVVIEDASHNINWVTVSQVAGDFYPIELDPKFKDRGYPPGFTTTRPGTRGGFLYDQAGSDQAIRDADERYKDTVNAGEWGTLAFDAANPSPADRITAPVLMVFGDEDNFYCTARCSDPGSVAQLEQRYYPRAACYELYIQPDAGHSTGLHRSAPQLFSIVINWTRRHVGNGPGAAPTAPCRARS